MITQLFNGIEKNIEKSSHCRIIQIITRNGTNISLEAVGLKHLKIDIIHLYIEHLGILLRVRNKHHATIAHKIFNKKTFSVVFILSLDIKIL